MAPTRTLTITITLKRRHHSFRRSKTSEPKRPACNVVCDILITFWLVPSSGAQIEYLRDQWPELLWVPGGARLSSLILNPRLDTLGLALRLLLPGIPLMLIYTGINRVRGERFLHPQYVFIQRKMLGFLISSRSIHIWILKT